MLWTTTSVELLTVGVVDLDTVTASLLNEQLRRASVVANVVLDLLLRQRAGLRSSLERHVRRRNNVRVELLLEILGVGGAAERPQLEVDERALRVDLVDNLLPRRDLLLVVASGDLQARRNGRKDERSRGEDASEGRMRRKGEGKGGERW